MLGPIRTTERFSPSAGYKEEEKKKRQNGYQPVFKPSTRGNSFSERTSLTMRSISPTALKRHGSDSGNESDDCDDTLDDSYSLLSGSTIKTRRQESTDSGLESEDESTTVEPKGAINESLPSLPASDSEEAFFQDAQDDENILFVDAEKGPLPSQPAIQPPETQVELPPAKPISPALQQLAISPMAPPSDDSKPAQADPLLHLRMHPRGILGMRFNLHTSYTIRLCSERLDALENDIATFRRPVRREQAGDKMKKLRAALDEAIHSHEDRITFMALLADYEKEFQKVSLENKLNACFLQDKLQFDIGQFPTDPLSVEKEGYFATWYSQLEKKIQQDGLQRWNESLGRIKADFLNQQLVDVPAHSNVSEQDVLDSYVKEHPEQVVQLIMACTRKAVMQDNTQPAVRAELLAQELSRKTAAPAKGNEAAYAIRDFLEKIKHDKATTDLHHQIARQLTRLHLECTRNALEHVSIQNASDDQLLKARQLCWTFDKLQVLFQEKGIFVDPDCQAVRQLSSNISPLKHAIFAQLICNWAGSEKQLPPEDDNGLALRLCWLNLPTVDRIQKKLAGIELEQSHEQRLYQGIIAYMDAANSFRVSNSHSRLRYMQQCRFDLLKCQQELLVNEMERRIDGRPMETALGHGDFHQDLKLFRTICACRGLTAKYRPLNEGENNLLCMAGNYLWRDELSPGEIEAALTHRKAMVDIQYNFMEEFSAVCGDSQEMIQAFREGLSSLVTSVKSKLQQKKTSEEKPLAIGDGTADWKTLREDDDDQQGPGLLEKIDVPLGMPQMLERSLCLSLRSILVVAERHPQAFRRLCGNIGQLIAQLKKLFGLNYGEFHALLDQLSWRLSLESTASSFAGDEPANLDNDPKHNPELARALKRFQFFCDLSDGVLNGVRGFDLITSYLSGGSAIIGSLFRGITSRGIQGGVNRLPGWQVRGINNTVQFCELMSTSWLDTEPTNLFDNNEIARGARHLARGGSHLGSWIESIFGGRMLGAWVVAGLVPYRKRLNALTEAIHNVRAHQPGAWTILRWEVTKVVGITTLAIGASCLAATAIVTTGAIALFGSALAAGGFVWLGTLVVSSHYFVEWLNYTETIGTPINEAIDRYFAQGFYESSQAARLARQHCDCEAVNLLPRLSRQASFKLLAHHLMLEELSRKHWSKLTAPEESLVSIEKELEMLKPGLLKNARELANQAEAIELINRTLDAIETTKQNPESLKELACNLSRLGYDTRLPDQGLDYYLMNIRQQAVLTMQAQCGTHRIEQNVTAIFQRLMDFHREVKKGELVYQHLTTLGQQPLIDQAKQETTQQFLSLHAMNNSDSEQQRVKTVLRKALRRYLNTVHGEGKTVTDEELRDLNSSPLFTSLVHQEQMLMDQAKQHWLASVSEKVDKLIDSAPDWLRKHVGDVFRPGMTAAA